MTRADGALRILLIAQWYEPIIGGEEVHVRTLAHSLARRGHDVSVAALAHPDRPPEHNDGPVRVHRIRATAQRLPRLFADDERQSAPPFPDPGLSVGLRRVMERERPDVVHAHNWIVHSYLPVRDRSVPLVLTLHDHSSICAKKVLLFRGRECEGPRPMKCLGCAAHHYGALKGAVTLGGLWAMSPLVRREVDCYVAVTESVASRNGLSRSGKRHVVIPNFLPDDYLEEPAAAPEGIPNGPFLMFAGSLSRIKGIDVLLSAYAMLDATRPPLVLIGYRGTESIDALRHPPEGVHIITDQPRSAVAAAWRRSMMALVPSIVPESFGLVALEAMAFGRPVIASRIGGLPEVVTDEETGLLVRPGSASALAHAIKRLLDAPDLRTRMGRAARNRSREFTADRVVPRIDGLYRQLILATAGVDASPRRNQPDATTETRR